MLLLYSIIYPESPFLNVNEGHLNSEKPFRVLEAPEFPAHLGVGMLSSAQS